MSIPTKALTSMPQTQTSTRGQIGQIPYGERPLINVIDERARTGWNRPYASIPRNGQPEEGYEDVSYSRFANAINRCVHWLHSEVGTSNTYEPLAYMGPMDLRYQVLAMAATKAGFSMFFPSPRNSTEAFLSLIEESGVSILLVPSTVPAVLKPVLKQRPLSQVNIPELSYFLCETPVPLVALEATFQQLRRQPWVLLHTSGSTGIPKIITLRHGYTTIVDAFSLLPRNEMYERLGNTRLFVPFPPSHMAGLLYSLATTVFADSTIILPPPTPLTADLTAKVHEAADVEFSVLPPAIITELSNREDCLENLKKLKGLQFVGGPLAESTGTFMRQYTTLHNTIGATEYFTVPFRAKATEDWAWFHFDSENGGVQFRLEDNGLYEMVIVRDDRLDLQQAIFVTFPDIDEYHTKDLFAPHPSKPDHWTYKGRLDDVIVFSSGEKFNPVTTEGIINSCPEVSGSVVVGQGRFQAAVLIEGRQTPSTKEEQEDLRQKVLPYIEKANKTAVGTGRIVPELVDLVRPGKPLPRAGKGTVQRKAANTLYASEIDALYSLVSHVDVKTKLDLSNLETTQTSLQNVLDVDLGVGLLKYNDDFFRAGMDSLQTISLVRIINGSLNARKIETKHVYDRPNITLLAPLLAEDEISEADESDYDSEDDYDSWHRMDSLYRSARKDLPGYCKPSRKQQVLSLKGGDEIILPPNGGLTAWLQILGAFLINFNNWGLVNSWAPFQAYYQQSLLASHSESAISWIGTLQGALLLIVGVVSGPLFDQGFFKSILLGASILLFFLLMMLSLCESYGAIMVVQGLLIGTCTGLLFIPSIALISLSFTTKRGFALGIATAGGSFGGIIYPIVFRRVLESSGFPWACRVIGFIALATLGAACIFVNPTGSMRQPSRQLIDWSAFKELPFIAMMVDAFFEYAGVLVPFFLAVTFATSQLDTKPDIAFYLIAVLNVGQLFGRIVSATLSDYTGPEVMLFVAQAATSVLSFCWIGVNNLGGFVVWALVYGFASGAVATLAAAVLPYMTPNPGLSGTRLGMVYGAAGVGLLVSTPIASAAVREGEHGYLGPQVWSGAVCAVGTGVYWIVMRHARRRRQEIQAGKKRKGIFGVVGRRHSGKDGKVGRRSSGNLQREKGV